MQGDVPCRQMETRVCPRSLVGGCADDHPCMRFEANEDTPGAVDIWEEHWWITDEAAKR